MPATIDKNQCVKLWYWDTGGDGEPIVLLHPATGSGAIWEYQQPVLAKAGYRVISYSRRGHLGSESGSTQDPGTATGDLYNLIEYLGLKRVHLVGSAAGGFIVPDFALTYPERLYSMVMACTQGGISDPAYLEVTKALRPPGYDALPPSFKELGPSYRAANLPGVERWAKLEASSSTKPRIPQKRANPVSWERFSTIKTPSLLIAGDADLYYPPARLRVFASHLPTAEAVILSESGHSGYWEQPQAFNSTLLAFFAKHGKAKVV